MFSQNYTLLNLLDYVLGLDDEGCRKLVEEKYKIPWYEFQQQIEQGFQSIETVISEMPGYGNKD